jgi:hypothetical protein
VKPLALVASALWSLAAPVAPDSGLVWDRFEDARVAYTLRIPPGWHATVHHGATLVTSVPVEDRYDNPERVRLPRGGFYLWIFDYGRIPGGDLPRRRDRLQLGRKEMHSCGFGEGYMLHFRDRGRMLQAFVKLGPFTGGREALAVLNSLRVTK